MSRKAKGLVFFEDEGVDDELQLFDNNVDGDEYEDEANDSDYEDATVETALELVQEGEILIKQRKHTEAAEKLSRAVAILSANCGEGSDQCADALFLYGKALYECAVEKGGLFSSDSKVETIPGVRNENGVVFSEGSNNNNDDDEAEPEEDDCDDLQLAYEVLTLAQCAFERMGEDSANKLAEVLILLGNVHLELENTPEASSYFEKALEIRLKYHNARKTIRDILEARYYNVVGLQSIAEYEQAYEQANLAIKEIDDEVEILNQIVEHENKSEIKNEDDKGKAKHIILPSRPGIDAKEEIKELQSIRKGIEDKVEDLKLTIEIIQRAKSSTASNEIKAAASLSIAGGSQTLSPKGKGKGNVDLNEEESVQKEIKVRDENSAIGFPGVKQDANVVNITQLVRKKRKQTDEENIEVPETKDVPVQGNTDDIKRVKA